MALCGNAWAVNSLINWFLGELKIRVKGIRLSPKMLILKRHCFSSVDLFGDTWERSGNANDSIHWFDQYTGTHWPGVSWPGTGNDGDWL